MKKRKPFSKEESNAILAAFQSGQTMSAAGAPFGRSQGSVKQLLGRLGIPRRGKYKTRTYTLSEDYFATIDTDEKAYWLGFLAADGCVQARGRVELALATADFSHIAKFRQAIGSTSPIRRINESTIRRNGKTYLSTGGFRVAISSLKMTSDLIRHGVVPRKTHILTPWESPILSLQIAWWRGYFDGDGCISIGRQQSGRPAPRVNCAGTHAVIEAFIRFVEENTASRYLKKGQMPRLFNGIYVAAYKGVILIQQFLRLLYQDASVYLDRKKMLADTILAIPVQGTCDHRSLNREALLRAKEEGGTWEKAAAILNIPYRSIFRVLRREGLTSRRPRGRAYSTYSREAFLEAKERLGNWSAAAIELGIPIGSIDGIRRYFGLL